MKIKLTVSGELFSASDDFDCRLKSFGIFRTTGKESSAHELVDSLIITIQIACVRCRMDGRMGLIVFLTFPWFAKATVLETGHGNGPNQYVRERLDM